MEQTVRMTMQAGLKQLVSGADLTRKQAVDIMSMIMGGEATDSQIAGVLTALRIKGETKDEITGFAEAMRSFSNRVATEHSELLDTCGTGGSGIHKFNISTASAFIAAAAGVRVAKHGNRAMSGRSGSADVLEALGVQISITPEQAAECLKEIGICFMFAQVYHPSMRYSTTARKELGVRTVFNMLGPLTNPAGADRQLLGIYDRTQTTVISEVLGELGLHRAMVVSSHDGLDEISISAPTTVSELRNGKVETFEITPEELGLTRHPIADVVGGEPAVNAAIIRDIFTGKQRGAYRDIVLANAGACIYLGGLAASHKEGVGLAAEVIDSGKAKNKLDKLVLMTGELTHVS